MPPYDEWNRIDDEEEEELLENSFFEGKRDVILFCIDCSESMLELRDDPNYEDVKICHLFTALEAAMQIQKRKILVGPNDSVGIMLFNTTRKSENGRAEASELKRHTFVFQPISLLSAPKVQELIQLLDAARENPTELRDTFPPLSGKRMPMGDVFTSCNWVLRDGAPKTATKRIFLITDEDNPHAGPGSNQLITSAKTTLDDLVQAGVLVEPFFISTDDKPFDVSRFYSQILLPTNLDEDEEMTENSSLLPESISISRIEDLLNQMRIHEVPKRALFTVPFQLAEGFVIGVKGYGLVTEQKKGSYKYFVDLGDRMEVANSRTAYVDEEHQTDVGKTKIVFGMSQGANTTSGDEEEDDSGLGFGVKVAKAGQRPFYNAEEIRSFRTLGLEPGIRLLGFKDRGELRFGDNIKHSQFIYPDEMEERTDENGFIADPPGIHVIPIPFADNIRAAPIEEAFRASDDLKDAARAWIDKLSIKNGTYSPDSYPNPALAYHNAQLQASAFREEFDPDAFDDLTEPNIGMIHKRAGALMKEWKLGLLNDDTANIVVAMTGSKRKADTSVDEAEIRSKHEAGALGKLRVDQLKNMEWLTNIRGQPNDAISSWLSDNVLISASDYQCLSATRLLMASNLHEISSTPHFQNLLSEDLNRISLIYFWAPWAEPCKQMSEVVVELSRKYPTYLFLQVEAEEQDEIAQSFDIESVPSFILLRGHVLLGRIAGADATGLTQLLQKHASNQAYRPLSHTDQKPAEALTEAHSVAPDAIQESPEELEKRLRNLMNQSKVVLFMKGTPDTPRCGFSRKIVGILQGEKIDFTHFDILTDEDVRQGLKKLNDWPTFPQLIINGELVGGLDIVQELVETGELKEMLV
ncbi:hypothetical protein NP233_g2790 [Leucocoprinus birnbaumii]|uniref:ATP-dependent DNA helicase II subunit 1 n=1 Tax=Leucocoprinus birnbaumii TaxID=56174 RepID=A0AAD5VY89_9AGAR|nr:hypothetical protein NP233_g2790 [Leucocoprinus birnbaumii]